MCDVVWASYAADGCGDPADGKMTTRAPLAPRRRGEVGGGFYSLLPGKLVVSYFRTEIGGCFVASASLSEKSSLSGYRDLFFDVV